jgi:NADP-dependent 3-hydroxy-3-methylglutaryl-CoA reductase
VSNGRLEPLPRIPARGVYTEQARLERLEWLRAQTDSLLAPLQDTRLDPARMAKNVENMIGAVEIPVGLAGPLLFRGQHATGLIYGPLATTEGTLVASASRGASALTRSGGVRTRVLAQRMTRAPVFVASSLSGAATFADWISARLDELREQASHTSQRANLTGVRPVIVGRAVHVVFEYETADAAGQNMTTACTWHACRWLLDQARSVDGVEIVDFLVEGNLSGDKKVTFESFLNGRGTRVIAEADLDADVVERVLNVTPERLLRVHALMHSAGVQGGMVGYNVNVSNVVAGMFTALGQDIACVHESSTGHLQLEPVGEGVRATMLLSSLILGTVGGGTHLPAQRALLAMLGCEGPGGHPRLAEIVAGFCLGLDLSTLAAVASNEFASAHERLGRNRPVRYFSVDRLTPDFFEPALRRLHAAAPLRIEAVEPLSASIGSSIVTEHTAQKVQKFVGFLPLRIHHVTRGHASFDDVIVKVKPLDEEVMLTINSIAASCGPRLAAAYERFRRRTGFALTHLRELAYYEQDDERLTRHLPRLYQTYRDEASEAYVLVIELLTDARLIDSAGKPGAWCSEDVDVALRGLGSMHSVWLGRERELYRAPWLGEPPSSAGMVEMAALWEALAEHGAQEFPELVGPHELARLRRLIETLAEWWPRIEELPRTLIHNDFNPRNIALRERRGEWELCAYDPELATVHLPQYDLAELLCFVLDEPTEARVAHHLEVHRAALEAHSGMPLDPRAWREGYGLALRDLAINRFGLYLMAHRFRDFDFLAHALGTLWRLLALEDQHTLDLTARAHRRRPPVESLRGTLRPASGARVG